MSGRGFQTRYLEEPEINFRDDQTETSPKRGLIKYGPRLRKQQHHAINVGIVGDRLSIDRLRNLFEDMRTAIHPDPQSDTVRPWRVPYPGTGQNSPINLSIDTERAWQQPIGEDAINRITSAGSDYDKLEAFVDVVDDKVKFISDIEGPSVIMVCIPEVILNDFVPEDQEEGKIQAKGTDFHNRVKLLGMDYDVPTQLIKPDTLKINSPLQKASRAWNLTVGLLYKSQEGYPWKTKSLEPGTCYAGIGFYRVRGTGDNVVRAAVAHVFTSYGYTILQSKPMRDIEEDDRNQPHLSETSAEHVADMILDHYRQSHDGNDPQRLVVHKPSTFWEGEREGLQTAAQHVGVLDLVHIREHTDLRLFTPDDFTVQRGRLLSIPADRRHYLFTTGYDAGVTTYEGSYIPGPIEIRPDETARTEPTKLCEEVLLLTKLDWNTPEVGVKMPVTIKVARRVGRVLSDRKADPEEAKVNYYYYM